MISNKLELKNFCKSFKDNILFQNVNVEFTGGNVYGIVGPNGCGKSVLLKCICALLNPTQGEIIYNNEIITMNNIVKMNIGASIEKPTLIDDLTVMQNLLFLASFKKTIDKKKINYWIEYFDLLKYKNKKIKECSLGTKQKTAIIQAIMEDQNLILLDEVTNSLDQKSKEKLFNLIKTLKENKKIVIYVNHSKDEINRFCDVVYKIEDEGLHLCEKFL